MLHELFLTTSQTSKISNAIAKNMLMDIRLIKAELSNIIQSGGFLCNKVIKDLAILLTSDNLPGLVNNLVSNATNKFEQKINEKGTVRSGKWFTLFILNEDMNDIIKIIKSLKDSGVLIDGVSETVKHEHKNQEGGLD